CTFTSNSATIEGPHAAEVFGGAVAGGNLVTSSADTFTYNSAISATATGTASGGALMVLSGSALSSGDTFTSNLVSSAGNGAGGALFLAANFIVTGAKFTGNVVN